MDTSTDQDTRPAYVRRAADGGAAVVDRTRDALRKAMGKDG